jgi:hypothetical protein
MNKRPVLFISVSIGWAIRNFFQTGIIEQLKEHFEVVVLATPKASAGLSMLDYQKGIRVLTIECGKEPLIWRLIRQLKKKVYMEGRRSTTETIREKYRRRPVYQQLGGWVVKCAIQVINPHRLYGWLEWLDFKVNATRHLAHLFAEYRPALYFATHSTGYFEEYLLRNALAARVATVFMILSWDHLSSKILLNRRFHSIFVWNCHTKQELLRTYPSYREEQIRVVGIPQYDLYAEKPQLSYENWCRKHGLDPARRTILFSTMPQLRHDQQHIILEELLKAISSGAKLPGDLQVMVKCHPFDSFNYETLSGDYPVAIYRNSLAKGQEDDDWLPSQTEMETSRDCLYFCSININIFSTVTIEAAYFDKPIIHIAFDPLPVKNRVPCREYYNWEHFKHIVEKKATILVHNYEELFEAIRQCSANPAVLEDERKLLVKTYIGQTVGRARDAVVNELVRIQQMLRVDGRQEFQKRIRNKS